jgi:hypothetical protein
VSGTPLDAAGVVLNLTAVDQTARGYFTLYPAGQALPATSTLNYDSTQLAIANGAIVRVGTAGRVCVDAGVTQADAVIDIVGYLPAASSASMPLLSSPARLADTRTAGGAIQPGTSRCFPIAGLAGIPSTAAGVLLNVTATGYPGSGFVTVYPGGQPVPATSTLNVDPRVYAFANNAIVRLGGGQVCVFAGVTASQVILDAVGYLTSSGVTQMPLLTQPQRLVDTRTAGGAVTPGSPRCFTIGGQGGIPANASGVVLNLTATGQTSRGFLTLYPAGQAVPPTSTLNFDINEVAIANGAIARIGTNAQICVSAGSAAAQVIIDATGYLP